MQVVQSQSIRSGAVSSSSSGLTGSGASFSSAMQAQASAMSQYNNDIAAMAARNQQMMMAQMAARQGQGAGSAPYANLSQGLSSNDVGLANNSIAEMTKQNAQMMQVQIAMQRENQLFTSVSNVLKTKHDTVKNSISNIR
jgi:hypothetical protein